MTLRSPTLHPPGNSSPRSPDSSRPGPARYAAGVPPLRLPGGAEAWTSLMRAVTRCFSASRPRSCLRAQWLEPTRHPRCLPNPEPSSGFQPARSVAARELPVLPCGAAGAGPASSAGTRGWPGMNESASSTRLDRSQGAGRPLLQLLAWPGRALNSGSHLRAGRPVWSPVLCTEHAGETLWG